MVETSLGEIPAAVLAPGGSQAPWDAARRAFMRDPVAIAGLAATSVLVLATLFGPALAEAGWFGAGEARAFTLALLHGLRATLSLGAVVALLALAAGAAWGVFAGVAGGLIGALMRRIAEMLASAPLPLFVIASLALIDPANATTRLAMIVGAIAASAAPGVALGVYAQTVALRAVAFAQAARAAGAAPVQVLLRHGALNVVGGFVTPAMLILPAAIAMESAASFLGFGVRAPLTSLGALIAEGLPRMAQAPWLTEWPCLLLAGTLLALRLLGSGLRKALDEARRGERP